MTFKPGYVRHKRVYSFRAYVDERGWNVEREHEQHEARYWAAQDTCDCLKMWDLNWTGTSHNIIRITRGRGHFVVLLGRKYRKIGWSRKSAGMPR